MTLFSSLTNRIFVASALLAVVSIASAMIIVNLAVTDQAERELLRGLDEAGILLEEYRGLRHDHVSREARLIADLPRLKAAVASSDPPTVRPIAEDYQQQLGADILLVTDRHGGPLAVVSAEEADLNTHGLRTIQEAVRGGEASMFVPQRGGILQVVSVPIWIDPRQPEILGTLTVGMSLDARAASRVRALTNSEVAFAIDGHIQASTLPAGEWPALAPLLTQEGISQSVPIGGQEYIALTRSLAAPSTAAGASGVRSRADTPAQTVILRSRTERLRLLSTVHRTLAVAAVGALFAAILISYATARTVTRPLAAVTAAMREMAATGDLTRRITRPPGRWEDEDATLLASTFNTMTDSIARFQREAGQRERLSSLGRLSTVVAHEIRNPLMIIKTVLRSLRRDEVTPAQLRAAVADIDEEVARLNRIVTEVLDFARPIRFHAAPADLNALCRDAAQATELQAAAHSTPGLDALAYGVADTLVTLQLDPHLPVVQTDGERLRLALVNILANAREAALARGAGPAGGAITVTTASADGRIVITVRDRGAGIATEDLPRVFDPYFTTRRTGTGLGLAISRNIVEGLGGSIGLTSRLGEGTEVRIELPTEPAANSA